MLNNIKYILKKNCEHRFVLFMWKKENKTVNEKCK